MVTAANENDEDVLPVWLEGDSLAPPCPSDEDVCRAMIELSGAGPEDTLMDLGGGEGHICIIAAREFGVRRVIGVEIEGHLIEQFRKSVAETGTEETIEVIHGDIMTTDLEHVSVIVTYLLPEALEELKERLTSWLRSEPNGTDKLPLQQQGTCCSSKRRLCCSTWGIPGLHSIREVDVGPYNSAKLRLYDCTS